MRVLHVIDSGGLYGAEMVLLNLAVEQRKMGLEPVIASIGERREEEKPLEREAGRLDIRVEKFRMAAGPNIPGALKILAFARKEKCDLLHSHGYKGNILFGFMPNAVRKMPLLSTVHGWTNTGALNRMRLYEWLDGKALRRLDAVVLVSEGMRRHSRLQKNGFLHSVVIPNGIPLREQTSHQSRGVPAPIRDFCSQGFIVGAIGRLSQEKGFDRLLEAVKISREHVPGLKLLVIGEGGQREQLERKIGEFGLTSCVLLPGYLPHARQYLPFFNIFVISSLTEGLPITLLEAMQEGVPIVATSVGGIPEALDHGRAGLIVKSPTPADLAEGIMRLHRDSSLRESMTETARARAAEKYSSKGMAASYLAIYQQIISRHS
jgi:glycosyltransferase involved in cell wall biosynthesis